MTRDSAQREKDNKSLPTDYGAQNSENPQFLSFPLAYEYDMNAARNYEFDLTIKNHSSGALLASDTIFVNVQRLEPASFLLIGLGLVAVGLGCNRRTRKA